MESQPTNQQGMNTKKQKLLPLHPDAFARPLTDPTVLLEHS
jgi:hypothetical protein